MQITGGSTYIVSLPKKWVEKVGIKNGDSLVLFPQSNGTLLINPRVSEKRKGRERAIEVDSAQLEQMVRKFIGAYLAGYDTIKLKANKRLSPEARQKIREITHNVVGTEIIDELMDSVTVQDLLDSSDFSLKKGVRRMHLIARGMHKDAVIALNEGDENLAKDVESRDDEVDRLYWMIAKQYNLILKDIFFADKMEIVPIEALSYLLVARAIERIADHAKKLASNIENLHDGSTIIPKITNASDKIIKVLDSAMNSFYGNRFEDANETVDKAKGLAGSIQELMEGITDLKGSAIETISLAYIIDSLERTRSYALDIAEIAINHQFTLES